MVEHQTKDKEDDDRDQTIRDFKEAVNMTAAELKKYLGTEASKSVGWTNEGEKESVGHKSGERIVDLLHEKKADYSDDDLDHMKKVVSYVHRHLAQKPKGDVEDTRWRHSLMNWGHDPLKKQ